MRSRPTCDREQDIPFDNPTKNAQSWAVLAPNIEDRILDGIQSADVCLTGLKRLHADNEPTASNNVLERRCQNCPPVRFIVLTPWFRDQPADFIRHQDRTACRIAPKRPQLREVALGYQVVPFLPY